MQGDEIAARLRNLKGAKAECPICGSTKWAEPGDNGRAMLTISNREITETLPLIPLVCENCGFVRLHDESRLHD
jgi:hypothetical protein